MLKKRYDFISIKSTIWTQLICFSNKVSLIHEIRRLISLYFRKKHQNKSSVKMYINKCIKNI